jgi:glycosyltransferase involved in cell wall biosynthesis
MMSRREDQLVCAQLVETLNTGGAENLAVQIANARAAAGDRSFLYVLSAERGELADRVEPAVTVRRLGLARAPIRRFGLFAGSVVQGYRQLASQIRRDGVQVVQSHLPGPNFWALLLAERGVCAVAATVHNTREFDYGDRDNPVRRWLRHLAYRRILRRCDATIAVSEEVRKCLLAELGVLSSWPRRLEVVTNGVAVPPPLSTAERAEVRARAGVPRGIPYLIAAGRLTPQKDFATFVAAAARLRDDGVGFHAAIGGEGELRTDLERLISGLQLDDRVRLPGVLPDLRDHFRAADVFILPSRWEGLPLVLLEAMACGLPVVCTQLEGLEELVGGTGAGVVVPAADPAALADGVRQLLTDDALRTICGQRARAVIEDRYDFRQVSERLGGLYRELAARRVTASINPK